MPPPVSQLRRVPHRSGLRACPPPSGGGSRRCTTPHRGAAVARLVTCSSEFLGWADRQSEDRRGASQHPLETSRSRLQTPESDRSRFRVSTAGRSRPRRTSRLAMRQSAGPCSTGCPVAPHARGCWFLQGLTNRASSSSCSLLRSWPCASRLCLHRLHPARFSDSIESADAPLLDFNSSYVLSGLPPGPVTQRGLKTAPNTRLLS